MKTKTTIAAAIAAAGLAVPALAQDSVSNTPGTFVGDALNPWDSASQRTDFVVTLTPFMTSGGAQFGVAPLLKSSKSSTDFFSSLVSAQTVSATEITADGFAADTYLFWDMPGGGVNLLGDPAANSGGEDVAPTASGEIRQFAAGFGEFATTDTGASHNGAISGVVQYDLANPNTLYVSRVIAATTGADETQNNGAMGTGTVDASGYHYFRADNNGATGPAPIVGNNIYRVDLLGRTVGMVNSLSGAGASDAAASDQIVANETSGDPFSTPGNIPADVAGRPVYVGLTFRGTHAYESSAGTFSETGSHLASADQRGTLGTYVADLLGNGGVATAGHIGRTSGGATNRFNLYSMDGNGNVAGSPVELAYPVGTMMDFSENFTVGQATGSIGDLDHYHSQTAFNGGNAPIAIGRDAEGRGLVAGVSYITNSGNQDPFNAIVVGRFDESDPAGTVEWGIGAYVDIDTTGMDPNAVAGKPVYDGMGNEIGQLRPYAELMNGQNGPSLSGVAFDGAGNIWFTGLVQFPDPENEGEFFLNTTLLRGVYEADVNGGFGYRLEKVMSFFDEFESQGTGLNYRVFGFQIVDSNSVNSGAFWSSNVKQGTFGDVDPSTIDPSDPRSTAGVVVSTSITYDVDGDGDFTLNTDTDPTTIDEAYNVLLYIAPFAEGNDCPADLDGNGSVGSGDLAILLAAWGGTGVSDLDGSGTVGSGDLAVLLAAWGPCN